MPTKYPQTERVPSGRLVLDDEILVRARQSDHIPLQGSEATGYHAWGPGVPPGRYRVVSYEIYWKQGGRKASRYYLVSLRGADGALHVADVSSVQRWNRVQ